MAISADATKEIIQRLLKKNNLQHELTDQSVHFIMALEVIDPHSGVVKCKATVIKKKTKTTPEHVRRCQCLIDQHELSSALIAVHGVATNATLSDTKVSTEIERLASDFLCKNFHNDPLHVQELRDTWLPWILQWRQVNAVVPRNMQPNNSVASLVQVKTEPEEHQDSKHDTAENVRLLQQQLSDSKAAEAEHKQHSVHHEAEVEAAKAEIAALRHEKQEQQEKAVRDIEALSCMLVRVRLSSRSSARKLLSGGRHGLPSRRM